MFSKKQLLLIFISIMTAASLCIGFIVYFSRAGINENINQLAITTIDETTYVKQHSLNTALFQEFSRLEGIAQVITDTPREDYSAFLGNMMTIYPYANIYLLDNNGHGVDAFDNDVDLSELPAFMSISQQVTYTASTVVFSPITGVEVSFFGIPVRSGSEFAGAIIGEIPIEYITALTLPPPDGYSHMHVLDREGNIVISSDEDELTSGNYTNNIFDVLTTEMIVGDTSHQEFVQDLQNMSDGQIQYALDGSSLNYVRYVPLAFNGWFLAVVLPQSAIAGRTDVLVQQIISITSIGMIVVIVSSALAFTLMMLSQRNVNRALHYDQLTGLPNLEKFKLDMKAVLRRNPGQDYMVVRMDISNFKSINQLFGYHTGDEVLKAFSKVMPKNEVEVYSFMLARAGNDEFFIFAKSDFLKDLEDIRYHYESILFSLLREQLALDYPITIRYGRYRIPQGYSDVNEIVSRTILAHNFAKDRGTIIQDYNKTMQDYLDRTSRVSGNFASALLEKELTFFLQPQVDLHSMKLCGAEALVRWNPTEGGTLFPDEFIPILEQSGDIVKLDLAIVEQVCDFLKNRLDKGASVVPISVNFSRKHLANPNTVQELVDIATRYGVPHNLIVIELTETAVVNNPELIRAFVDNLSRQGFRFSIDDFGSGYSSLGMLQTFHADEVKLDRSFIATDAPDDAKRVVIGGVISMLKGLNSTTVAEGVETEFQLEFLKELGYDVAQGYYFSKPMPVQQFESLYLDNTIDYL